MPSAVSFQAGAGTLESGFPGQPTQHCWAREGLPAGGEGEDGAPAGCRRATHPRGRNTREEPHRSGSRHWEASEVEWRLRHLAPGRPGTELPPAGPPSSGSGMWGSRPGHRGGHAPAGVRGARGASHQRERPRGPGLAFASPPGSPSTTCAPDAALARPPPRLGSRARVGRSRVHGSCAGRSRGTEAPRPVLPPSRRLLTSDWLIHTPCRQSLRLRGTASDWLSVTQPRICRCFRQSESSNLAFPKARFLVPHWLLETPPRPLGRRSLF